MNIEVLPKSLLNGKHIHCRPIEDGPVVKAQIIPVGEESIINYAIICPARRSSSKCALMVKGKINNGFCQYYKGDGLEGGYQIIGPGADEKLQTGYR